MYNVISCETGLSVGAVHEFSDACEMAVRYHEMQCMGGEYKVYFQEERWTTNFLDETVDENISRDLMEGAAVCTL